MMIGDYVRFLLEVSRAQIKVEGFEWLLVDIAMDIISDYLFTVMG